MRPFREYVREKLLIDLAKEGIAPPSRSGPPVILPFQEAVNRWFETCDVRRASDRNRANEANKAFRERRKAINAGRRRAKDVETKRQKRLDAAITEGRILRPRADLSHMSEEEKLEHRRKKEREKKRRQRSRNRYAAEWQV